MKSGILFIIFLVALTDICDTVSQLFLKTSINALDFHINTIKKAIGFTLQLVRRPLVWIGFLFSTASLVVWIFVLSKTDLNIAFSLDSMRYIMISFAATVVLKEKINTARWLGIVAVVCGITLVAMG